MARSDFRFSRRQLREVTGWGDTQLKVHLGRLTEMEYVIVHRGSGGSQRFGYELVYERGAGNGPFLPGLIGADELGGHAYDDNRSGDRSEPVGAKRRAVGVWSAPGRWAAGG